MQPNFIKKSMGQEHPNNWLTKLTHWHTQTSLRRPGSLGPLIHSRMWDAIQRPTQHHSTTRVCI